MIETEKFIAYAVMMFRGSQGEGCKLLKTDRYENHNSINFKQDDKIIMVMMIYANDNREEEENRRK